MVDQVFLPLGRSDEHIIMQMHNARRKGKRPKTAEKNVMFKIFLSFLEIWIFISSGSLYLLLLASLFTDWIIQDESQKSRYDTLERGVIFLLLFTLYGFESASERGDLSFAALKT